MGAGLGVGFLELVFLYGLVGGLEGRRGGLVGREGGRGGRVVAVWSSLGVPGIGRAFVVKGAPWRSAGTATVVALAAD